MPFPHARDLTDLQWAILDPLIPEPPRRKDGRGRPWKGRRSVLSASFGRSVQALPGLTCLNVFPPTRRAIADFSNGCGQESCEVSSKL